MKSLSKFLVVALFALAARAADSDIGAAGAAALAAAGDNALFYLHARNPQELLSKINSVGRQVQPNFNTIQNIPFNQVLHSQGLEGVDLTQPMTLVKLNTKKYDPDNSWLAAFIATDADAFLGGVGADAVGGPFQLKAETKLLPIREFNRSTTKVDSKAYDEALAAGQNPNKEDFTKKTTESFFVGVRDKQIIIGPKKELVEKAMGSPLATPPRQILSGDLVASFRMPAIMASYDTELKQVQQQFLGMVAASGQQANVQILAEELQLLLDLAKASQTAEIALSLAGGNLELATALVPKANSDLSKFLAAQANQKSDLVKLAPAQAAFAGSMTLRMTPEAGTLSERFAKVMSGLPGITAAQTDDLVKLQKEGLANWGGEIAWYGAPPSETSKGNVVIIQRVNDSTKARANLEAAAKVAAQLPQDPNFQQTQTYQKDAAKSGAVSLDKLTVSTTTNNPQAGQFLTLLGLNEMSFYVAFPPKFVVMTFGSGGLDAMPKVLDALKANQPVGLTQSADYQSALRGFPADSNGVFYLSVERLVQFIVGMLPPETAQQAGMFQLIFASSGINFSGYATVNADNAQFSLRIPLQKIQDTAQRARQMFQQPGAGK